jgi:pantoate--beta-alanine ligase
MRVVLEEGRPDKIDYITMAGYSDLQPVDELAGKCVIAVAAFFGPTRLIDNMVCEMKGGAFSCVL